MKHISIEQDFVILKSEKKICDRGPHICKTQCSGLILLCGCYTNEFDKLEQCKKEGCLQSPETIVLRSLNYFLFKINIKISRQWW